MSAWLITGGAGFIGSNFVRLALEHAAAPLIVVDNLTYAGDLATIKDLLPRIQFVEGDICDAELIASLFQQHEFSRVIHFAAESHVDRSILGPGAFVHTNVAGTSTMLEAARQAWKSFEGRLFLHVSTDEVYGSLGPDDPPFNENSPYLPNSPYAASKAGADHLVWAWHKTYGLPAIITNCSNNYGPWQYPEKLIPLMILNALEGKPLPVYGDGRQIRDWIHVEDHCRGLMAVMEKGQLGETYVIGAVNEVANIDIVHQICSAVDESEGRVRGDTEKLIRNVEDRPGHDRRYALDSTKVSRKTGWKPIYDLHSSLPMLVDWYKNNQAWLKIVRAKGFSDYYERQYAQR